MSVFCLNPYKGFMLHLDPKPWREIHNLYWPVSSSSSSRLVSPHLPRPVSRPQLSWLPLPGIFFPGHSLAVPSSNFRSECGYHFLLEALSKSYFPSIISLWCFIHFMVLISMCTLHLSLSFLFKVYPVY